MNHEYHRGAEVMALHYVMVLPAKGHRQRREWVFCL
jgi:hypothetical protein